MNSMLDKSQKNKGIAESSLADPGQSGVNEAGTGSKIDTPLTQPRSGPVRTPDRLTLESLTYNLEEAQGFLETARGRAYSLGLECTADEISRALSRVEGTLYEIQAKTENEFEPFREP